MLGRVRGGPRRPAGRPTLLTTCTTAACLLLALWWRALLAQVVFLVLDEADKLLDMGFTQQVDALLAGSSTPGHHARALFSATLPDKVNAGGQQAGQCSSAMCVSFMPCCLYGHPCCHLPPAAMMLGDLLGTGFGRVSSGTGSCCAC